MQSTLLLPPHRPLRLQALDSTGNLLYASSICNVQTSLTLANRRSVLPKRLCDASMDIRRDIPGSRVVVTLNSTFFSRIKIANQYCKLTTIQRCHGRKTYGEAADSWEPPAPAILPRRRTPRAAAARTSPQTLSAAACAPPERRRLPADVAVAAGSPPLSATLSAAAGFPTESWPPSADVPSPGSGGGGVRAAESVAGAGADSDVPFQGSGGGVGSAPERRLLPADVAVAAGSPPLSAPAPLLAAPAPLSTVTACVGA